MDLIWSLSFFIPLVAALYIKPSPSIMLLSLMYAFWSLRLSIHIFKRTKELGEDERYQKLKKDWKIWGGLYFFGLFQGEAFLTLILSFPLFLSYGPAIGQAQWFAFSIFLLALFGESIADKQLKDFVNSNPRSEVCATGMWRYSRHPNYFFEWLIWVSFALFGLSSKEQWLALIPPAVMYILLTRCTGIPPAEQSSLKSKGRSYELYQEKTSAFFPWFPKLIFILALTSIFAGEFQVAYAKGDKMVQQQKIESVFKGLTASNLFILDDFYAADAKFIDPLGAHSGLESIKNYYKGLYEGAQEVHFETIEFVSSGNTHVYFWKMRLIAPGLNKGDPIELEGNSLIKFNSEDLVVYHRDFFDMGEFIYQHIPVLGWTIKKINSRLRGK